MSGVIETNGKLGDVVWSPTARKLALICRGRRQRPDLGPADGRRGDRRRAARGQPRHRGRRRGEVAWQDAETLLWIQASGVGRSLERQRLDGLREKTLLAGGGPIWSGLSLADGIRGARRPTRPGIPTSCSAGRCAADEPVRVTDSNPWLAERRLATQEVVEFEARDGVDLQGLLIRRWTGRGDRECPW